MGKLCEIMTELLFPAMVLRLKLHLEGTSLIDFVNERKIVSHFS